MTTTSTSRPRGSLISRIGRWCFHHRKQVLAGWLLALVIGVSASALLGSTFQTDTTLPGTDSQAAYTLLAKNFPAASGEGDQLVVQSTGGALVRSAPVRASLDHTLARIRAVSGVISVDSPYAPGASAQINPAGTVAFATINWNSPTPSSGNVDSVIAAVRSAQSPNIRLSLGGDAISDSEGSGVGLSVAVGVLAAFAILLIAFRGALFSSTLPLLAATLGLLISLTLTDILSHIVAVPSVAVDLSVLIGLGVGVDYGLFVISRHRSAVKDGLTYEDATVQALTTSGRTVLFAGLTVCIALLGQIALGVGFLDGLSITTALTVALTMATSLTLLPAMFGFLGPKVLSRRERRTLTQPRPPATRTGGFWWRWAAIVDKRRTIVAVGAFVLLGVITLPALTLRIGSSDSGTDPAGSNTRQAYDTLSAGFGPGINGPLILAAHFNAAHDRSVFTNLLTNVSGLSDVAAVSTPTQSPNGSAAVATVYPTTGPAASQTADLVNHLRQSLIPAAEHNTGLSVHVGGTTASNIDFSRTLASKMPMFIAIVVLLAFLLLMIVFRSLLIPLLASVMNLLSIGAALGAVNAVFNWGFGQSLLHLAGTGPIDAFLPVLLFSILFGLSMDYEVYLISRMQEEWNRDEPDPMNASGRDLGSAQQRNQRAIRTGQAASGPVIAAAALIMILVFGSFLLGDQRQLQEFGFGLAFAVLLDALLIRSLLIPAIMQTLGAASWYLPASLGRVLPRLELEPHQPDELQTHNHQGHA